MEEPIECDGVLSITSSKLDIQIRQFFQSMVNRIRTVEFAPSLEPVIRQVKREPLTAVSATSHFAMLEKIEKLAFQFDVLFGHRFYSARLTQRLLVRHYVNSEASSPSVDCKASSSRVTAASSSRRRS